MKEVVYSLKRKLVIDYFGPFGTSCLQMLTNNRTLPQTFWLLSRIETTLVHISVSMPLFFILYKIDHMHAKCCYIKLKNNDALHKNHILIDIVPL